MKAPGQMLSMGKQALEQLAGQQGDAGHPGVLLEAVI